MTLNDVVDTWLNKGADVLADQLPIGVPVDLAMSMAVDVLSPFHLDIVGNRDFMLCRSYGEDDDSFRNRIKLLISSRRQELVPSLFEPKGCNHSWKTYVGLMNSFQYCEHCDEKKK